MSLYEILGMHAGATNSELRSAYRRLAQEMHPDKGGDAEAFKRLAHPWSILGDAERRAEYDRTGREDFGVADADAAARAMMMAEFEQALHHFVTGRFGGQYDLMGVVRSNLRSKAIQQRNETSKLERMGVQLAAAAERISHVGDVDGADWIGNLIRQKIEAHERLVAQMGDQAAQFERAAEMAEAWTWREDQRPGPVSFDLGQIWNSGGFVGSGL